MKRWENEGKGVLPYHGKYLLLVRLAPLLPTTRQAHPQKPASPPTSFTPVYGLEFTYGIQQEGGCGSMGRVTVQVKLAAEDPRVRLPTDRFRNFSTRLEVKFDQV
jgi:hypothetical protein